MTPTTHTHCHGTVSHHKGRAEKHLRLSHSTVSTNMGTKSTLKIPGIKGLYTQLCKATNTKSSLHQNHCIEPLPPTDREAQAWPQALWTSGPVSQHLGESLADSFPPPTHSPQYGAHSPSGVVSLSQSQASTMRVKERCRHKGNWSGA